MSQKEIEIKKKKTFRERYQKRYPPIPTPRSKLEEIGNSITHGVGAILAVIGLILLIRKSDTNMKMAASIIYGLSLTLMMTMSSLYHAFKGESKVKKVFRRFDYCGVYLLIGGTFTPLFLVYSSISVNMILFYIQWSLILLGSILILIFGPYKLRIINFILFFAIGYSALIFIPEFIQNNMNLFYMILTGGLVYTIGMIPFGFRKIKGAHFIWHFFVLVAALIHFFGIYFFVY